MREISVRPVRGRRVPPGWYIARRRDWSADARWSVVGVMHVHDGGATRTGVYQVGSADPEATANWRFLYRLLAIESLPAIPPPHPRIELADVRPTRLYAQQARCPS